MEKLPSDIILSILSRVPAETVLECKLVCKHLGTLIRQGGTAFTNMHLSRQLNQLYGGDVNDDDRTVADKMEVSLFFSCVFEETFGTTLLFYGGQLGDKIGINKKYSYKENLKKFVHPPMYDQLANLFVGSCNGLLCINIYHNLIMDPIYICNPITREYVYLPELVVNKKEVERHRIYKGEVDMCKRVVCGFGYVSSTNEYKVVRIHYPCSMDKGYVEVYTLGSGCGWRSKDTIFMELELDPHRGAPYVNGDIFFLAENNIMAFNLAKEEFRLVPFPPCMINYSEEDKFGVVELGGHLCFYLDRLRMEIWSLKKTNSLDSSEEKETWCMDFDIDLEGGAVPRSWLTPPVTLTKSMVPERGAVTRGWWYQPVTLTKNGEIILLCDFKCLYYYNPTTSTLEIISDEEEMSTRYFHALRAITHINTFVSLRAMGENSKTYKADGTWDDNVMIS